MEEKIYLNRKISDKLFNYYGSILSKDENLNKWLEWRLFFNTAKENYNIKECFSTFKKGFEIYAKTKGFLIKTKIPKNSKKLHFYLKMKKVSQI